MYSFSIYFVPLTCAYDDMVTVFLSETSEYLKNDQIVTMRMSQDNKSNGASIPLVT